MQYFSLISGVASILGFIITVANMFPTYAKIRNYFTIFALGCFIGSFIGAVKNININFPENPLASGALLFYIVCLIGLFFVLLAGIFTDNKEQRSECFEFVGTGFAVLLFAGMFILLFGGMFMAGTISNDNSIPQDDLLVISEMNVDKGNLDKAIKELDLFVRNCMSTDIRKEAALKRIEELKSQQAKKIEKK